MCRCRWKCISICSSITCPNTLRDKIRTIQICSPKYVVLCYPSIFFSLCRSFAPIIAYSSRIDTVNKTPVYQQFLFFFRFFFRNSEMLIHILSGLRIHHFIQVIQNSHQHILADHHIQRPTLFQSVRNKVHVIVISGINIRTSESNTIPDDFYSVQTGRFAFNVSIKQVPVRHDNGNIIMILDLIDLGYLNILDRKVMNPFCGDIAIAVSFCSQRLLQ